MNRERMTELKLKVDDIIREKDKRLAELQRIIEDCRAYIASNNILKDNAERNEDPETYQRACTLIDMYRDRLRKNETEQRVLITDPVLNRTQYEEVREFIEKESDIVSSEERAEIWEHLRAIEEIRERYKAYNAELHTLAGECERVNNASYVGDFHLISISSLPPHWLEDITRAMRFFRPKGA